MPPDGAAARADPRAGAGVVVAPDDVDGIEAALRDLHARWRDGALEDAPLSARVAAQGRPPDARRGARAVARGADGMSRRLDGGSRERRHRLGRCWSGYEAGDQLPLPRERLLRARSRRCTGPSPARSGSPTFSRSASWSRSRSGRGGSRVPRTTAVLLGFFAVFLAVYLVGFFDLSDSDALGPVGEGDRQVADPLSLPRGRGRLALAPRAALLLADARVVLRRHRRQRALRRPAAARRTPRRQPRCADPVADHRRREPDQHLRRDQRRQRLPAERAHRRPEPPRDHADRPAARPDAALPAARARAIARGAG